MKWNTMLQNGRKMCYLVIICVTKMYVLGGKKIKTSDTSDTSGLKQSFY